ncbi:MAG: hypothetical protein ABI346_02735 [Candidatus Baltobacteraceae bacterium]
MLIAAILSGLLLVVLVLALFLSLTLPHALRTWYEAATQPHSLVPMPVGAFRVPLGYVLTGVPLGTSLDITGRPYRMASVDGLSPDVLEIAAFEERDVSFRDAWYALHMPACTVYANGRKYRLNMRRHTYEIESVDCAGPDEDQRLEFVLASTPAGSQTLVAWGRAFDWREQVVRELLGSLQP